MAKWNFSKWLPWRPYWKSNSNLVTKLECLHWWEQLREVLASLVVVSAEKTSMTVDARPLKDKQATTKAHLTFISWDIKKVTVSWQSFEHVRSLSCFSVTEQFDISSGPKSIRAYLIYIKECPIKSWQNHDYILLRHICCEISVQGHSKLFISVAVLVITWLTYIDWCYSQPAVLVQCSFRW